MSTEKWWGYMHTNGSVQAKRFFSREDLTEAAASPFVQWLVMPFDAANRTEALAHVQRTVDARKHRQTVAAKEWVRFCTENDLDPDANTYGSPSILAKLAFFAGVDAGRKGEGQ